ncbi:anaphase-promoting complex, subunit 10-domain-containing protein [Ilyonectria sp. MPI-CAGE-AT-0026]|nr:anaphase-promoting complex, subunit 10-domain-containing protein [Ilyonectria sp. MPI-CAGE-AT-0026]
MVSLHQTTPQTFILPPPPSPLKRVPLQELPISSSGGLTRTRERTTRPTPSVDKENLTAVVRALEHRRTTFNHNLQSISEQFRLQRVRLAELGRRLGDLRTAANTHPAAQPTNHPRLSMPLVDSDDSGSEPDLSVLGMARPAPIAATPEVVEQQTQSMSYNEDDEDENEDEGEDEDEDEVLSQEQYEAEDTSVEDEQIDEEENEGVPLIDPATAGLKEISNLARFTVSSHKPGNGVEELRSDDLKMYWQSDGPQPHKLTVYFVKRVGIRDIRFFVDYNEDESYTPTKIVFKSGTSENNLIEFATIALESPVGWQQVPLAGAGGDPDGNTLVSYVLQMQILENHQNGKDTHLRGIKIYAFDADSAQGPGRDGNPVEDVVGLVDSAVGRNGRNGAGHRVSSVKRQPGMLRFDPGDGGLTIPDFMREPELR